MRFIAKIYVHTKQQTLGGIIFLALKLTNKAQNENNKVQSSQQRDFVCCVCVVIIIVLQNFNWENDFGKQQTWLACIF